MYIIDSEYMVTSVSDNISNSSIFEKERRHDALLNTLTID